MRLKINYKIFLVRICDLINDQRFIFFFSNEYTSKIDGWNEIILCSLRAISSCNHRWPMFRINSSNCLRSRLLYRKYHIEIIGNNLTMTWNCERKREKESARKIHESWSAGTPISTDSECVWAFSWVTLMACGVNVEKNESSIKVTR